MRRSDDPRTRREVEEIAVPERVRTREEVETSTGARRRTRRQNGRGGSEKGVYDCMVFDAPSQRPGGEIIYM